MSVDVRSSTGARARRRVGVGDGDRASIASAKDLRDVFHHDEGRPLLRQHRRRQQIRWHPQPPMAPPLIGFSSMAARYRKRLDLDLDGDAVDAIEGRLRLVVQRRVQSQDCNFRLLFGYLACWDPLVCASSRPTEFPSLLQE